VRGHRTRTQDGSAIPAASSGALRTFFVKKFVIFGRTPQQADGAFARKFSPKAAKPRIFKNQELTPFQGL